MNPPWTVKWIVQMAIYHPSTGAFTMDETLSIHGASKMAGKSITTVRRWIRENPSIAIKSSDGRWKIDRHNFMAYLAQTSGRCETSIVTPQINNSNETELTRTLHEALHRERQINDELRSQMKEKDSELLKLTYEMKSILEGRSNNVLSRWFRS